MATANLQLTIRTPEEELYEASVESVTFTSEGGELQVFANHASLTTSILFSKVVVKEGEKEEIFLARNGLFLFNNKENSAVLLALHCERKSEISHKTAKQYLEFIEDQLKKGEDLSDFQVLHLQGEKLAVEEQIQAIAE